MATVKCNFVIYCICIFSSISHFRNNGKKERKKVKKNLKVIFMSKNSCHIEQEDLLLRTLSLSRDDNSLNDRIERQDTTKQH